MKKYKIHLLDVTSNTAAACNLKRVSIENWDRQDYCTVFPRRITCTNCRRTGAFQVALANEVKVKRLKKQIL
jgi:hypothetical protein